MLNCLGSIFAVIPRRARLILRYDTSPNIISPVLWLVIPRFLLVITSSFLFSSFFSFLLFMLFFFLFLSSFPFSKKKKRENRNKEMNEKTQKNFFFLFSFPSTPNFLFYFKYDRKLVSVIVRKKKKNGRKEKISPRRTD